MAVADSSDGTINCCRYDGQGGLSYSDVFASGLERPQNISVSGGRLIVPDYGHGRVKLFSPTGYLQTTYTMPNDGYTGAFGGPAAAAGGPGGDLLVVDKAKKRVVFVRRGLLNVTWYLPVLVR